MITEAVWEKRVTVEEIIKNINKVNAMTVRVRRRKEQYLAAIPHICSERARLLTDSWKETEGEPIDIRSAKLFKKVVEGIPIAIREGELIVGSPSQYVRGASPRINWDPYGVIEACGNEQPTYNSEVVLAELTEADRKSLLRDAAYWTGKSGKDARLRAIRSRYHDGVSDYDLDAAYKGARVCLDEDERPRGAGLIDHAMVLNKGYKGIIAEARKALEALLYSSEPTAAYRKACFLQAVVIALEGAIAFAERYADLAEQMAASERDIARKKELKEIAETCRWVPANPARTFREALQSTWFAHLGLTLEVALQSDSLGRMDQYLFPFYEHDLNEGRLTRQEAAELLGCFWVKTNEIENVKGACMREYSASTQYQDVTICGVTPEGKDATNELSFLILEVTRQVRMAQPAVYLRYHNHINPDVLVKAAEVNRDYGAGNPAFVNDSVMISHFVSRGVSLADARDWAVAACAIPVLVSCNGVSLVLGSLNLAKVLELALNDGIDPLTGKQLGVAVGEATRFTSFGDLVDGFKTQVDHITKIQCEFNRVKYEASLDVYRLPFSSALSLDSISRGMDVLVSRGRYPQVVPQLVDRGHQDVADSLVAIKKLVYDDKRLTMGELLEALTKNFEGKEDIRRMLLAAPKYGNDDNYADNIFDDVERWTAHRCAQERDQGFSVKPVRVGASVHYHFGKMVGALPNGRKAGEPLDDGSLSPMRGMDRKGPTAVINSATRIPRVDLVMGTLLNMKLAPGVLTTPEGVRKFLALIKTYFDREGYHVQFNVLDKHELEEAQRHPEQYRDLLVRVAGYSAYFVELAKEIQDDIIARTEHLM